MPSLPPVAHTVESRIVVAMDFNNIDSCIKLAQQLDPKTCRLKIGKELFTLCGPKVVEQVQQLGFDVFLDLKFHDIPATVAKAVKAAAHLGVWMVNVHASGGPRMMTEARDALASFKQRPILIGVTVLTSMSQEELHQTGVTCSLQSHVISLAGLAKDSGLDGVVCSAQEAQALSQTYGSDFILVTPGIRPTGSQTDDQHRIVTPLEAVKKGSHYLVIGRPITQSSDPIETCTQIIQSLRG